MPVTEVTHTSVKKLVWSWTSDASGDVTIASAEDYDGKLLVLETNPDGGAAPADNYDIVVNDIDGHDVLLGAGANRDTLNTESVAESSLGAVAGSVLTLVVSNAGNAKQGVVTLFVR